MSDIRELVLAHPKISQLTEREREACIGVLEGAMETVTPVVRGLQAERDRYREALLSLHRTAERLMVSDNESDRGVGCAMAEVTRVVVEPAAPSDNAAPSETTPANQTGPSVEGSET